MKSTQFVCQLKPYIQPFERNLAMRELAMLTGDTPTPFVAEGVHTDNAFLVATARGKDFLVNRLAYWENVRDAAPNTSIAYTRQTKHEATTQLVRSGVEPIDFRRVLPFANKVPVGNRRNLRYGPHGIHEYRGKFFPQLVRSLLNSAGISPNAIVVDPMCGSGTTPTEAVLLGCKAYGIDMNPLSVLISQVKCDLMTIKPDCLLAAYQVLKRNLEGWTKENGSGTWIETLDKDTQAYLQNWFPAPTLRQLDCIKTRIEETGSEVCKRFFTVVLSNIIRKVSWQKEDDLRVRRKADIAEQIDVVSEYLAELNRSVKPVLALLYEVADCPVGQAHIKSGDSRDAASALASLNGKVDAIVTSPPYATALPYLDTDRLSLYFLGLMSRSQHRAHDQQMIGNREVSNSLREKYWLEYKAQSHVLIPEITDVINRIHALNSVSDAGFRRRNLPALLGRYFLDMRQVLCNFIGLLKPGAAAYVVVGNNHTIAGGERIEIQTDALLARLGESVGLELTDTVSMEMLTSRDIFRKNAGSAETIICFRRP